MGCTCADGGVHRSKRSATGRRRALDGAAKQCIHGGSAKGAERGRSSAASRRSRGPAAGGEPRGGEGSGGRQRKEGGGPNMWAPHVKSTSTSHADGLTSGTVIWTSREPISKFRDSDVYFGSLGTGMTPPAKFRGRRCILLIILYWCVCVVHVKVCSS